MIRNQRLGIINCGIGNFKSLSNALKYICNHDLVISDDISRLSDCDRLLIPGVGSFATASQKPNIKKLQSLLNSFSKSSRPILGICLGMQLLFDSSTEGGYHEGLKIINSSIRHFSDHPDYKYSEPQLIPHVGFNTVSFSKSCLLFNDIPSDSRFYFTHSYYAPTSINEAIATTNYGSCGFSSAVHVNNIYAVQFHPELSGKMGLQLLLNFINLRHNE